MKFYYGDDYFVNFINKRPERSFILPILKLYDKEILRFQFHQKDETKACGIIY